MPAAGGRKRGGGYPGRGVGLPGDRRRDQSPSERSELQPGATLLPARDPSGRGRRATGAGDQERSPSEGARRRRLRSKMPDPKEEERRQLDRGRAPALSGRGKRTSRDARTRYPDRVQFGPETVADNPRLLRGIAQGDIVIFNGHALNGRGKSGKMVAGMAMGPCQSDDPEKFPVELLGAENEETFHLVRDFIAMLEIEKKGTTGIIHCRAECRNKDCTRDTTMDDPRQAQIPPSISGRAACPPVGHRPA